MNHLGALYQPPCLPDSIRKRPIVELPILPATVQSPTAHGPDSILTSVARVLNIPCSFQLIITTPLCSTVKRTVLSLRCLAPRTLDRRSSRNNSLHMPTDFIENGVLSVLQLLSIVHVSQRHQLVGQQILS